MPEPPAITALPTPPDPGYIHVGAGHGYVKVAVAKGGLPPAAPYGHNGTIAIIEFTIAATPPVGGLFTSLLNITNADTFLKDPTNTLIPGVVKENGSYIIPEYALPVALSFFVTATAIVVLLRKKRIIKKLG
jgi:hypothetical protein